MNQRHKKIRSLILRLLTAAAILFNVLVPSIGTCTCVDCSCCNHSELPDDSVSPDNKTDNCSGKNSSTKSGCCSSNPANEIIVTKNSCCSEPDCCSANDDNVDGICSEKSHTEDDDDSEPCPCSLKKPQEDSRYFLKTSISFQKVLKEWQVELYASFLLPIQTVGRVAVLSQINSFETPTSRLPLRLHLLLLVLLN
ncbi:MAG: hypothetical protein LBT09_12720 [Planctomycetaceae bacterium]|jgi:hypothetical protein|nr:hypothetical protein [Planctomycetaceae bacterium]